MNCENLKRQMNDVKKTLEKNKKDGKKLLKQALKLTEKQQDNVLKNAKEEGASKQVLDDMKKTIQKNKKARRNSFKVQEKKLIEMYVILFKVDFPKRLLEHHRLLLRQLTSSDCSKDQAEGCQRLKLKPFHGPFDTQTKQKETKQRTSEIPNCNQQ